MREWMTPLALAGVFVLAIIEPELRQAAMAGMLAIASPEAVRRLR